MLTNHLIGMRYFHRLMKFWHYGTVFLFFSNYCWKHLSNIVLNYQGWRVKTHLTQFWNCVFSWELPGQDGGTSDCTFGCSPPEDCHATWKVEKPGSNPATLCAKPSAATTQPKYTTISFALKHIWWLREAIILKTRTLSEQRGAGGPQIT